MSESYLATFSLEMSETYLAIRLLYLIPIAFVDEFVFFFTFDPKFLYIVDLSLHRTGLYRNQYKM